MAVSRLRFAARRFLRAVKNLVYPTDHRGGKIYGERRVLECNIPYIACGVELVRGEKHEESKFSLERKFKLTLCGASFLSGYDTVRGKIRGFFPEIKVNFLGSYRFSREAHGGSVRK